MTMTLNKNDLFCALCFLRARRGTVKNFTASGEMRDWPAKCFQFFPPVSISPTISSRHHQAQTNLTRCGIFRGKVSRRKTQTNKNRLEERTLPAPNS